MAENAGNRTIFLGFKRINMLFWKPIVKRIPGVSAVKRALYQRIPAGGDICAIFQDYNTLTFGKKRADKETQKNECYYFSFHRFSI